MVILKRLGWYLVGLSIGLIFLVFFLQKKAQETGVEFCYLPNCRVLKDIRSKPLSYSESGAAAIKSLELDSMAVSTFLKEGKVDFGSSDTEAKPCKIYRITHQLHGQHLQLTVENCASNAVVLHIAQQ